MYHLYQDIATTELFPFVILRGLDSIEFCWCSDLSKFTGTFYGEFRDGVHDYTFHTVDEFLQFFISNDNANFIHLASVDSLSDLRSLFPEHYL